jgi:hypothetical protein
MSTSRLRTALIAAGSAVVGAVGVATFAAANNTTTTAEVCVGPDGQVRVADECRPSEERLIIQGDKGDKGDPGEPGPQGEKGDKGDKGDPGGVRNVLTRSEQLRVEAGEYRRAQLFCPIGDTAVSGGYDFSGLRSLQVVESERVGSSPSSSWTVRVYNSGDDAGFFTASVNCVDLAGAP